MRKAEIVSYAFKGIGLNAYPVIDTNNPDMKACCQSMKNQLNTVDCAKLIDSKVKARWHTIDERITERMKNC